jgi:hypothetical protein
MENVGCHGRKICSEILCLWSCNTIEEADSILERLEKELTDLPINAPAPPALWLQEALRAVCDGNGPMRVDRLTPWSPDATGRVYEKTINCYSALLRWLNGDGLQRAASDCIKWLDDEKLRRVTARTLLPAVLLRMPGNSDLLSKYRHLLADGAKAAMAEERDTIIGALYGLLAVSAALDSAVYVDLLEAGIQSVFTQWNLYGTPWCQAVHSGLDRHEWSAERRAPHLRRLVQKLAGHISAHDNAILAEDRNSEYNELVGVICHIHAALGTPRQQRPRNRHVVTTPDVETVIEFPNGHTVAGDLVNFSLGEGTWRGGAWIVSGQILSWAADSVSWPQSASLAIKGQGLSPTTVKNTTVHRPEPYGAMRGFRLEWTLDQSERTEIAKLTKTHPLRR